MTEGLTDNLERRVLQAIMDGFNRPSTISRRTCLDSKRVTTVLAALRKKKVVEERSGRYSLVGGSNEFQA
jgi:hypothetical protein